MSKRVRRYIDTETKVKVIAASYKEDKTNSFWLFSMTAAIFAVAFYIFSLFFSFTGGCALAKC